MSFTVLNLALIILVAVGTTIAIIRDSSIAIPKLIQVIHGALFFIGLFVVMPMGDRAFGLWLVFIGVIGWVIGYYYRDEIWQHGSLGFILIGLAFALFRSF